MKIRHNKNEYKENIFLINYSDKHYKKSQKINTLTGLKYGGFSKVISYSPQDIDPSFFSSNIKILNQKRGNGYWLWKPYFIKKTLDQIKWNECFFYSDSGCYFIDSILHLLDSVHQDLVVFELQEIEKQYTKRDTFLLMNCDQSKYYDTRQRLASFHLWKKTNFTMKFIEEWLTYSKDERLITDLENTLGKPNYEGFIDHRHDQSIFSLLTKKYNIKAYRDPSQFGNDYLENYKTSKYPQFIFHNRIRNVTLYQKVINRIVRLQRFLVPNSL